MSILLWAYREGDANMRSAWICTCNDVLGNIAVLAAAAGAFGTGAGWPDIAIVADHGESCVARRIYCPPPFVSRIENQTSLRPGRLRYT
jgi:hypothetical protein